MEPVWHTAAAMADLARAHSSPLSPATPGAPAVAGSGGANPWRPALAYTIFVILFGAVVRITGSGAACGQHWPTCQGTITHLPSTVETAIEYSHRVTSALSGFLVLGLLIHAFWRRPEGHPLRRAATLAGVFMVLETLIGAVLVKLGLVGENTSRARAVIMAFHLVNTYALTGAMLVAAWAFPPDAPRLEPARLKSWLLFLGALGLTVVSAAGAVTALGDTLYPATEGTSAALSQVQSPEAHFLERLRGVHPLLAILVSGFPLWAAPRVARGALDPSAPRVARLVQLGIFVQVGLGVVNVALSAPGWLQVIHLAVAVFVWLGWILLSLRVAACPPRSGKQISFGSGVPAN